MAEEGTDLTAEDPRPQLCRRCGERCDDLFVASINGKYQVVCPGCVGDRRRKGDHVVVEGYDR